MTELGSNALDVEEDHVQLFRWFQTLPSQKQPQSMDDLLDGEAFTEILESVDGAFFTSISVPESMEDKMFFLRDLEERMLEYISDKQQDRRNPAVADETMKRITEDVEQSGIGALTRILQLILVCTVVCPDKEKYINDMRNLDADVALVITKAIMEVMPVQSSSDPSLTVEPVDSRTEILDWCEKCGSLRSEVNLLGDERKKLLMINARLKAELELASDVENERSPAFKKIATLTKENKSLHENVTKMEAARDEYRTRCEELQDQLATTIVDGEQLKRRAVDADKLRDELEEWKLTADTLSKFEHEVKTYRKKIDEIGDIRERLKNVESRNVELSDRNADLEQENLKVLATVAESDQRKKDIDTQKQDFKMSQKRLLAAEKEIQDLQDQIQQLDQRNRQLESERGLMRQNSENGFVPLGESLSYEMELITKEKLQTENSQLRRELEILKKRLMPTNSGDSAEIDADDTGDESKQRVIRPSPALAPFRENGALVGAPNDTAEIDVSDFDTMLAERETRIKELEHKISSLQLIGSVQHGAEAGNAEFDKILAQRDEHITEQEREIEFLRRHYSKQQQMITAAWYQRELKTAQQATNTLLFGTSADDRLRPTTFLDTQRNAVGPPVNPSPRAQNSISASAYRLSSPRGSSRSLRQ